MTVPQNHLSVPFYQNTSFSIHSSAPLQNNLSPPTPILNVIVSRNQKKVETDFSPSQSPQMTIPTMELPTQLELSNQNTSCANKLQLLDNKTSTLPVNGRKMSEKESFCCAEYRTRPIRSIPRKEPKEKRTDRRRLHYGEKMTAKSNKMEVKGRFTIIDLSPESPEQVTMRKHIHTSDYEEETKNASELSQFSKRRDNPTFQHESSLPVSTLNGNAYSTVCAEKSPSSRSGRQFYRESDRQNAASMSIRQSGVWENASINSRRPLMRRKEASSRSGKYTLDSYASTAEVFFAPYLLFMILSVFHRSRVSFNARQWRKRVRHPLRKSLELVCRM